MTVKPSLLFSFAALACVLFACTPKTTEKTSAEPETVAPPAQEAPEEKLSPCPKFSDAPQPDEVETNYVLYRDFLKAGDYTNAYNYWQKVYEVAPAADGKRNTVFSDGIFFYERLAFGADDSITREKYIDLVFEIYDELDKCYPEGGYISGRKAFDLFYKYPSRATKEEMYRLFKQSIDTDGLKTQYFVLNPFTSLLVDLYFDGVIPVEEAQKYQQLVRDILAKGLATCKGVDCEPWKIIQEYVPARLEAFETVEGFYDCAYYSEKYYPEFQENPDDCDVLRTVFSRLTWGGCPDTLAAMRELVRVGNDKCVEEKSLKLAYTALKNAKYRDAIELFQQAEAETSDPAEKAKINLLIAKVYYSHLKNFSRARQYALIAAGQRSNWGEPYLLVGRLYASSGPLCGPGTGWDSQVVVWPAIDMWSKAKAVDPSVASEANNLINRYRQYMPSKEDIFQRNLKEGDTFRVGCWIQETTVIRAAPY